MKDVRLLVELQSYGVRMTGTTVLGRKGGAGPAEGIIFIIGGKPISIPSENPYVTHSPCGMPHQLVQMPI